MLSLVVGATEFDYEVLKNMSPNPCQMLNILYIQKVHTELNILIKKYCYLCSILYNSRNLTMTHATK